jgi:predicted GNAT superfamily acetyltransferase
MAGRLSQSHTAFLNGTSMSVPLRIDDIGSQIDRDALLNVNNASARETSLLTPDRFNQLIDWASVALVITPAAAFLLAFQQSDDYDGGHFLWFRNKFDKFLYIDRVVVRYRESVPWALAVCSTPKRSSAPSNWATHVSSAR